MRLLVTRPEPQSLAFAEALAAQGHAAVLAPMLTIEGCPWEGGDSLAGIDAVAVTSARSLPFLPPAATALPLFAVGTASAESARKAGFRRVEPAAGNARALADLLRRRLPAGARVLHASGADLAQDLAALLADSGIAVERRVLYRARAAEVLPPAAAEALAGDLLDGATFFSPRTARTFVRLAREVGLAESLRRLTAFCISSAVAAELQSGDWQRIIVSERAEGPSLEAAIESISCGGGRT